jgi:hypothetical protein
VAQPACIGPKKASLLLAVTQPHGNLQWRRVTSIRLTKPQLLAHNGGALPTHRSSKEAARAGAHFNNALFKGLCLVM